MSLPYTPAASDATVDAFTGVRYDDPGDQVYVHDYSIVTGKWFFKPVQDELLALIKGQVARQQYRQTFACASGRAVGDPVYVSANNTVALASSTSATTAKIIGFIAYKPTTTTCYISHFYYASGLSGLTANSPVYLNSSGVVNATPTIALAGMAISTTEALLFASAVATSLLAGITDLTGDVTATGPGSAAATIAAGVVTLAKMANIATDRLIGRDTAGTGVPEALTVGGGIEFTGSTGIQRSALTGDVTATAGSNATTIANLAVTNAKIAAATIDLTAKVTGILPSANGGTANGFTKFSGPATSEKTFTLPNASAAVLTDNAAVTVAQGGTGVATLTAYAPVFGGTTGTGAVQSGTTGTAGHVLTSNGAGVLPTFQAAASGGAASSASARENISFAVSVSSGTLTVAIKQADGSTDPGAGSAAAKVSFRPASATANGFNTRSITAALSAQLSTTQNLGVTTANVARVWVGLMDNAGTPEVWFYMPKTWTTTNQTGIKRIWDGQIIGTTNTGTAHQTFTSTTNRSTLPSIILGYFEATWTSGTGWTAISAVQAYEDGMLLPGQIVNVVETATGASATGTTVVPTDNTTPLVSEGDQYQTLTVAPISALNVFQVDNQGWYASSAAGNMVQFIGQDSGNALATMGARISAADDFCCILTVLRKVAGSTTSTTFYSRAGQNNAGTTTFNGRLGAALYNGTIFSFMRYTEYMV